MAVGGLVSEALVALLLYSFTYLVNSLASGQSFHKSNYLVMRLLELVQRLFLCFNLQNSSYREVLVKTQYLITCLSDIFCS